MSRFTIEARWETPPPAASPPREIGQLYWQPLHGRRLGFEALWCRGKFKILAVTRSLFGLFFETSESCRFLRLGSSEHLKSVALTYKCAFRPPKEMPK